VCSILSYQPVFVRRYTRDRAQKPFELIVHKVVSGFLSPRDVQTAMVKTFRDLILWFTDHDQMKEDILKIASGAIDSMNRRI